MTLLLPNARADMNSLNPSPSEAAIFNTEQQPLDAERHRIAEAYLSDEASHVEMLLGELQLGPGVQQEITSLAASLVARVRAQQADQGMLDAFMQQYDLSSEEGVLLMCLAEALLRIPDADTANKLIKDKLGGANWKSHMGKSDSMFVNASTWGLMLTGRVVTLEDSTQRDYLGALNKLISSSGEPVIRQAVRQAMRIMGHQYVKGRTIDAAIKRAGKKDNAAYRYSYDMLGEAALTAPDAERYFQAYQDAIQSIGKSGPYADVFSAPSISVKLSALHPRYELAKRGRVLAELTPRVVALAKAAKDQGIALSIDAEEVDRLQLSLDVFEAVYSDPQLAGWQGLGLALQAYLKTAPFVIAWLKALATRVGRRIPVRLVKGAYWDTEIKRSQEQGLSGYPVFTRKQNTDVSYLACARRLLDARDCFYPQFASHNAQTVAAIYHLAGNDKSFEFQRLHGMGEELYAEVIGSDKLNIACRAYAPVGRHEDLLPYLVRRLLENGANTSFVNRIVDQDQPIDAIVADPIAAVQATQPTAHPGISLPINMYGELRDNSRGVNLGDHQELLNLSGTMASHPAGDWQGKPLVAGATAIGEIHDVTNPADHRQVIGQCGAADESLVEQAIAQAVPAALRWDQTPVDERAACLERAADLLEERLPQYMSLCVREAGKTIADAVAEIREAVDFCRYYAAMARQDMGAPVILPGPTGESNQLSLHGRGVFVCISPWNFPLAIFMGQVTAALAAGNAVLAKPAEVTNLVAFFATRLLHEAGIPEDVLQFLPGAGSVVGAKLTSDPRVSGVAFTGSIQTAHRINRSLAARSGTLARMVAETGGQNCMISDSSALPEQLVNDVLQSAFYSAGQRCSAMRVLFVQRDVAERVTEMLAGAMDELQIGDPALVKTDVGPVIDARAQATLNEHCQRMDREAKLIKRANLPDWHEQGTFVAPAAYQLESLEQLQQEVFGPILHVIPYRARDLDQVIDAINGTGFGLTLGVHTRIESTANHIAARARVGNCYINRNMVGAVVGVQPFGGEGLSGTGPKAGGPHYLHLFTTERTLTVNTAAVGGNASLLAMED
jgi:RHH-type proline utilization regulon transcriptional repressor/proline dehydrogenase/delta 1-pyrroline-5-carboxylate dehydrogenase